MNGNVAILGNGPSAAEVNANVVPKSLTLYSNKNNNNFTNATFVAREMRPQSAEKYEGIVNATGFTDYKSVHEYNPENKTVTLRGTNLNDFLIRPFAEAVQEGLKSALSLLTRSSGGGLDSQVLSPRYLN